MEPDQLQEIPDIRDIVTPEAVPDPRAQAIIAVLAGLVALAFAVALVRWWLARRRWPAPPLLPPDPRADAVAALAGLRGQAAAMTPSELARQVGEILDRYLHRAVGVPATFRTAEELAGFERPGAPPPLPQLAPFAPLLRRLAEAKFAGPEARQGDAATLIDAAAAAIGGSARRLDP
jgi:hypothetical protein